MGDATALWAANTFLPKEKLDCWAANVTKTATGFHWDPYTTLPSLSYCRKDVRCDAGKQTCNCYVTAKPMEAVFIDAESQTGVMYQCTSLRYAANTAIKNLGDNAILAYFINLFSSVIDNLHFSSIGVMTQQPFTMSAGAKQRLADFLNSFPDQEANVVVPGFATFLAKTFGGYNGKPTYSVSDFAYVQQSEKVCHWSTRP